MTPLFRVILILVSLFTLCGIVKKVRNAKVQIESSLFWLLFSILLLILSIFPQIAEFVADLLGIYSTVNFIFLFVIFVLLMSIKKEVLLLNYLILLKKILKKSQMKKLNRQVTTHSIMIIIIQI